MINFQGPGIYFDKLNMTPRGQSELVEDIGLAGYSKIFEQILNSFLYSSLLA